MHLLATILALCLVGFCSAGVDQTTPPTSSYGHGHGQGLGQGHGQGLGQGHGQGLGQGHGQGFGQINGQGFGQINGQGYGQNQGQTSNYGQSHGQNYGQQQGVGQIVNGPGGVVPSRYIGCFRDQRTPRTLPLSKIVLQTTNSPQQCIHACAGFKYAGVESKDECFCGNEQPAKTLPQTECKHPCPGDRTKTCGGHWAMDVHTVPHSPRPNIDYKGCFKDKRSNRVLPGSYGVIEHTLTPYQCANMCHGYKFAGVEQGKDCHCGNTIPPELIDETKCNTKCTGDNSKTCGGTFAIAVYEIYLSPTPYG